MFRNNIFYISKKTTVNPATTNINNQDDDIVIYSNNFTDTNNINIVLQEEKLFIERIHFSNKNF